MTLVTLNLPDSLAEKLKSVYNVDQYVADVLSDDLEDLDEPDEEEIEATVKACKEGLADFEKGNFMPLEEFITKQLALRNAEARMVGQICKERMQGEFVPLEEAIVKRIALRR
jgi:predicted transcriptional regulator